MEQIKIEIYLDYKYYKSFDIINNNIDQTKIKDLFTELDNNIIIINDGEILNQELSISNYPNILINKQLFLFTFNNNKIIDKKHNLFDLVYKINQILNNSDYINNLDILASMGFMNRSQNLLLLIQYNNNLENVVNLLL